MELKRLKDKVSKLMKSQTKFAFLTAYQKYEKTDYYWQSVWNACENQLNYVYDNIPTKTYRNII